jgi:hypothetical protein
LVQYLNNHYYNCLKGNCHCRDRIITILLFTSRVIYNFLVIFPQVQDKLPSFGYGWVNVSDQVIIALASSPYNELVSIVIVFVNHVHYLKSQFLFWRDITLVIYHWQITMIFNMYDNILCQKLNCFCFQGYQTWWNVFKCI